MVSQAVNKGATMRLLFVTETVPFEPRNGIEYPLRHIIAALAQRHDVDLAVLCRGGAGQRDFELRRAHVPDNVNRVLPLHLRGRSRAVSALRELIGIAPVYFHDDCPASELSAAFAGKVYDVAYFSPFGTLGLVAACRRAGIQLADRIAVGHNDINTTLALELGGQLLRRRRILTWQGIQRAARVPYTYLYERRFLRWADWIVLQSPLEERRLTRVLPEAAHRAVIAPNGRKVELDTCRYQGCDSARVLYMTQLAIGRVSEYTWFLTNVWPRVRAAVGDAELWLAGGLPHNTDGLAESLPEGAQICGYVPELSALYDEVAVAVVSTAHGTGFINRVADALVAGVPLVGCREPLATIPGLEPGRHAIVANTAEAFADSLIGLLRDRDKRLQLAAEARALGQSLPTWPETVERIESALLSRKQSAEDAWVSQRA